MKLTTEQLQQVYDYASALMTVTDIAYLIGVSPSLMKEELQNENSDLAKTYYKAKAETAYSIKVQEVDLALKGSPLGLDHMKKHLEAMDMDEL